jgi:hypothetical protein
MATSIDGAPPHKIIRLGGELRVLRIEANLKLADVVDRLKSSPAKTSWDPTKLSKIERAKLLLTKEELSDLLDCYGASGEDRIELENLLTEGPSKRWWREFDFISPAFAEFLALEAEAPTLWEYPASPAWPGLVQHPNIAGEMAENGFDGPGDDQVEDAVTVRLTRQRRLTEPPILTYNAFFSEVAVLLTPPGMLAEQIRYALKIATYPNVALRMVPLSAGHGGILASGLTLLDFADERHVFIEAVGGMLPRGSGREVRRAERTFARLGKLALSQEDTIILLNEKLEAIK